MPGFHLPCMSKNLSNQQVGTEHWSRPSTCPSHCGPISENRLQPSGFPDRDPRALLNPSPSLHKHRQLEHLHHVALIQAPPRLTWLVAAALKCPPTLPLALQSAVHTAARRIV